MKTPISKWNERFLASDDYIFGKEPNAFLVRQASSRIKPGMTVLAIADGEGRNGVWLAEQGCEVWSVDSAPAASDRARALATERGVDMHVITADATEMNWSERQYDLVVGIFFQFANPQLRAKLFNGMKQAIKPGGYLLIEGYGLKQLDYKTGGPGIPEHLYTLDLMREYFGDMHIEVLEEYDAELSEGKGHHGMSALVDLVARKP
ncbi:MAG: class I SAM-dependent methyltransferase [Burkholderiaceae bacterium]|nr:class I SAM-dependent methyltransferase [Burkholderiaceae bacterium]MCD8517262.1 class I SAM-dependent methyltransferase [Burkholderiaceae bacterium]MCD8537796.1 class I SAM-dependent methyltransferase [Burkholderiaceae bacterium]MCD8564892.1 class I SAM-dependent methyltransferase [Burkholderiaceae bacterium]